MTIARGIGHGMPSQDKTAVPVALAGKAETVSPETPV